MTVGLAVTVHSNKRNEMWLFKYWIQMSSCSIVCAPLVLAWALSDSILCKVKTNKKNSCKTYGKMVRLIYAGSQRYSGS